MTATATASNGTGPRYAPEDPTLPKPWKGLVDGSTGYLYYWNPVTNVTQYERPVAEELPPPPPLPPKLAPLSSVQVHNHHDEDGRSRSHQLQSGRYSGARSGHGSVVVGHGSSGVHGHVHGAHPRTSSRNHGSSEAGVCLSAEAYRKQHEITVTGNDVPAPYMTFESTDFPPEILKEVRYLLQGGANVVLCCIVLPSLLRVAYCRSALHGDLFSGRAFPGTSSLAATLFGLLACSWSDLYGGPIVGGPSKSPVSWLGCFGDLVQAASLSIKEGPFSGSSLHLQAAACAWRIPV